MARNTRDIARAAAKPDRRQAEREEELREEYIDRTGRAPSPPGAAESREAEVDLRADARDLQADVDPDAVGLGDRDVADVDTGLPQFETREVHGDLQHDVGLEMGSPGGQEALETDPRSMVSDGGGRTPLDDVYDAIEAEEAAADAGTPDAGGSTGEAVSGGGYQVPGTTYDDTEGITGGPDRTSDSPFLNALADVFSFGPKGSTKREALDQAMDEIDATSGGSNDDAPTDAATPTQPAAPGQEQEEEEEEEGFFDWLFGDDEEEEAGSSPGSGPEGAAPPESDGGTPEDKDDKDESNNEPSDSTDDETGDDTDDEETDDGTEVEDSADPPPDEDHDPESQAPPPTQEQVDAAKAEMEAEQTWDVDPDWDDPSGDGPSDDSIRMEDGRPYVDPYETVDGSRRPDLDIPEDTGEQLQAGLGDLVQPTDDDPDGTWGGEDPSGVPDDPYGGNDPAAAMAMTADVEAIAAEGAEPVAYVADVAVPMVDVDAGGPGDAAEEEMME